MWDPLLRIHDLPVRVLVARPGLDVGMRRAHDPPLVGVALLEMQALRVRAVAEDHRMRLGVVRTEDVRAEHEAVVHHDRHVPFDDHAVTALDTLSGRMRLAHWRSSTAGPGSALASASVAPPSMLARCRRVAAAAASGSRATSAARISRCSSIDFCLRPGARRKALPISARMLWRLSTTCIAYRFPCSS